MSAVNRAATSAVLVMAILLAGDAVPGGADGDGSEPAAWSSGLNLLHEHGFNGAGRRVAVIDTSVNTQVVPVDRVWENRCGGPADTVDGALARHTSTVVSIIHAIAPAARIDVHPVGRASLTGQISCDRDRSAAVAEAFDDARGSDVIVITSTVQRSLTLDAAVQQAISSGSTVVAARPESSVVDRSQLFSLPGVIGVQAVDRAGQVPTGHAVDDPGIDVLAQGVDMPAFGVRWGRVTASGTSMAAPVVAGVLAATGLAASERQWLTGRRLITPKTALHRLALRAQLSGDTDTVGGTNEPLHPVP